MCIVSLIVDGWEDIEGRPIHGVIVCCKGRQNVLEFVCGFRVHDTETFLCIGRVLPPS